MTAPTTDNPGVIAYPPLLFVATLGVGLLLHWFMPWQPLPNIVARPVGGLLFIGGMWLAGWGRKSMERTGTNIDPREPALAIATTGPFGYTRNPLYVAITAVYLGVAMLVNAVWPLILAVPLMVVTHFGIVRREERYLEGKFGDTYRAYRANVRRWL